MPRFVKDLLYYPDSHSREKRLLLDEVVQVKKEKDLISRESQRKDTQIQDARDELDKTVTALRSAETRIQLLRNQVWKCKCPCVRKCTCLSF